MTKQTYIAGVICLIVGLLVGGLYTGGTKTTIKSGGSGEPSGFDNVFTTGGLYVGAANNQVGISTLLPTGEVYALGGVVSGGTNSTSTPASLTLLNTDISNYSSLQMLPTVGSITVTLPASSTLATYLPNSGDSDTYTIYNATSTANENITIAGGTGTLLRKASTTAAILPGGTGVLNIMRKANSDLVFSLDVNI